ncbi:MAG: GIY-YIG nuclease family protein [Gammaproteobacteria bacterium]
MDNWYVYVVRCADGTLYTGIATDVRRRIAEHNGAGRRGAKCLRGRRPVRLVYQESFSSRSDAMKREYQIKQFGRALKERLVTAAPAATS